MADPDRVGFAQTLAGAHELLEHYRTAPDHGAAAARGRRRRPPPRPHPRADRAAAARRSPWRCGARTTARPGPRTDWFADALAYATRPLRSDDGVRALIPLDDPDTADRRRPTMTPSPAGTAWRTTSNNTSPAPARLRPVPDAVWEALRAHTSRADDLIALARRRRRRGRYRHAEALYRAAAAAGDPDALRGLAGWLGVQPGREADAEAVFREAAAAGDPDALPSWPGGCGQPGREADAEAAGGRRPPPATRTRCASWPGG